MQASDSTPHKREKPNKIVIIGDSNVGKTCLIDRYCDDKFTESQPTIGALHKIKTINDIQLDIWDTAGQERFKSMIPMYYKGAKAIIVAFDITSLASFDGAKKWMQEIDSTTSNILIVLLANKIDLVEKRVVTAEQARTYADDKKIPYYETSAKENLNIKEVFEFIANKIKEKNNKIDSNININNVVVNQDNSTCGCG